MQSTIKITEQLKEKQINFKKPVSPDYLNDKIQTLQKINNFPIGPKITEAKEFTECIIIKLEKNATNYKAYRINLHKKIEVLNDSIQTIMRIANQTNRIPYEIKRVLIHMLEQREQHILEITSRTKTFIQDERCETKLRIQ
jgi:hypothetical protein